MKWKQVFPALGFLACIGILTALFLLLPKQTVSTKEKRELAKAPEFSADALFHGEFGQELEDYLTDHFPGRDLFVGLNAYAQLATGRNGAADIYYGKDGYLINAPKRCDLQNARKMLGDFQQFTVENHVNGTLLAVPSTGYIMADKLPRNHQAYCDDAVLALVDEVCPDLAFVDLREPFQAAAGTVQLYYKTDHHITAAGAYEAYKAYCRTAGLQPWTDYTVEKVDGFYGTTYAGSGFWGVKPDTIELWQDSRLQDITVTIDDGEGQTAAGSVFFREHLEQDDKYPVYLDGNHGYVKIENPNASGGKLLIVKDSFAHCLTTFLAAEYKEIVMIDLRYYKKPASELLQAEGIDQVLFVYGMDNLLTDTNTTWLK